MSPRTGPGRRPGARALVALVAWVATLVATLVVAPVTVAAEPQPAARSPPPVEILVGNRPAAAVGRAPASGERGGRARQKVDINTASHAELAALPGIDAERARSIERNRPYARKDDLVRRKVVPRPLYVALRDRIVARR